MNRTGFCPSCDEPIAEIKSVFSAGHPLAGHANKVGRFDETCVVCTFLLASGKWFSATLCANCAIDAGTRERQRAVWGSIVDAGAYMFEKQPMLDQIAGHVPNAEREATRLKHALETTDDFIIELIATRGIGDGRTAADEA